MTLAAETRRAARDHPFLVAALRAGVVNYTAAARFLGVDGDDEAVATALRRFADDLPPLEASSRDVRVRMESGVAPVDDPAAAELLVGGTALGLDDGDRTAIVATGPVDAAALGQSLGVLAIEDVSVDAAGVGDGALVVVVDGLDAADAVRAVERALSAVPDAGE